MTTQSANARPTRHFFIDMLTANIALEDAILDLVDNAIDALSRTREIDLSEKLLFSTSEESHPPAEIFIKVSAREISIQDNCGGIQKSDAIENVFRIGRIIPTVRSSIGVYGIGLKRAIFKIGNSFELRSYTTNEGFVAHLEDIEKWADDDSPEWNLPVDDAEPAVSSEKAGTTLRLWNLREPVKRRIEEGTLLASLKSMLGRTYPLFLDRFVTIWLNKSRVEPVPLPVAESDRVEPAVDRLEIKDPLVSVTLLAGVSSQVNDEWNISNAGWYIVCNGRVVVSADKTELTGWGTKLLPQFHSKYRAFAGIAFFFSKNPAALPWTTTKRGINRDSTVFQRAQPQMATTARQVLSFLNRLYPGEISEAPAERAAASSVRSQDVRKVAAYEKRPFRADVRRKPDEQNNLRVQFDVTVDELETARRCMGKAKWSGAKIGRYAFDYLLRNECGHE